MFIVDAKFLGFDNADRPVTQSWRVAKCAEKELEQVLDI